MPEYKTAEQETEEELLARINHAVRVYHSVRAQIDDNFVAALLAHSVLQAEALDALAYQFPSFPDPC